MKPKIYFRADGSQQMGLGHIYRSLAVAEMLKNEFDCHFIIRDPLPSIKLEILKTCNNIIMLSNTRDGVHEVRYKILPLLEKEDIVVLDGYHFDTAYQKEIVRNGSRLVCIDDIHKYHFIADAVINHAGDVLESDYSLEDTTRLCTGPGYALLRKVFCEAAKNRKTAVDFTKCFVCLGGADPNNDTLEVLKKLESEGQIKKCYVVTGAAFIYKAALKEYILSSKMEIIHLSNLSAEEMVEVMQLCGVAICPPSSISYEYLSVGGLLYLHQIADNQDHISAFLERKQLAFPYIRYPISDQKLIEHSIQMQSKYFDGGSPKNLLQLFKSLKDAVNMPVS